MNYGKLLLVVIVGVLIVGNGVLYYQVSQPTVYVDQSLVGNDAAQAIQDEGIPVYVEELGEDGNGYTVRGQCQWISEDGGVNWHVTRIVLDDDVDDPYEQSAVLWHELGHAVHGINSTEEQADGYAGDHGYVIVDAYHGIH